MKKIMILGGGINQILLLREAKELGYTVILCDFREEIEGKIFADKHYVVNTLSYEQVLNVCRQEKPDGIITNSEPAIPVMTRVANDMGLISNSVEGIDTLMSKSKFRTLQESIGLYSPKHFETSTISDLFTNLSRLEFPVIIKPCECSGSRGSEIINEYDKNKIEKVFSNCINYSRNKRVEVEEFVEMQSLTTIEGDVFICNDYILWDGLFYTTRASYAPMVPMTYTIPLNLDQNKLEKIKEALTNVFCHTNIHHGEYNFEGFFNRKGNFFIIEINVRQGGHEIPEFIERATGINMNRLLVSTSVGDERYLNEIKNTNHKVNYNIKHVVFSDQNGIYDGLSIDERLKGCITEIKELKGKGVEIEKCINGSSLVAIVDMEFPDLVRQHEVYDKMENLIKVKLV